MDSLEMYAVISALASSFLAACALYPWYKTRKEWNRLEIVKEYSDLSRNMLHQYGSLDNTPKLKGIISSSCESYHVKIAKYVEEVCITYAIPFKRLLDVGSGSGKLSFMLSTVFEEVLAMDINPTMTWVTNEIMETNDEIFTNFPAEGSQYLMHISITHGLSGRIPNVIICNENVCNLSYTSEPFSCILVVNTLTHLQNPKKFLSNVCNLVVEPGLLIIADVYNWNQNILGESSNPSIPTITKLLEHKFEYLTHTEIPFFAPQCSRLALVGNSEVTVWKRNP